MRLLLVEDERILRVTLRDVLEEDGWQVTALADGGAALRAAEDKPFDLVLTDVRLPGLDGLALFRRLRQIAPDVAVVLMTAYADFDDAVAVMREGARDYVVKPFETDELLLRLGRVRRDLTFRQQMAAGGEAVGMREIRGISTAVRRLQERLAAAAACDAPVLITGETGSGKELCARTIHARSRRVSRPFIVVNCGAIPESLLESELFGHVKGAFTGADRRRTGRFEAADGGTLFLDEVGELPAGQQVKVLRAIETGNFDPVGSSSPLATDVRVIAATNRDLREEMAVGRFRTDLFYRLNVIDVEVPPLRRRRADIPLLVAEFLADTAQRQGRPQPALDPSVVAALATYDFPGNVRELIHALERAVAVSRGDVLRLEHLPPALAGAEAVGRALAGLSEGDDPLRVEPLETAAERFELEYIRRVLRLVDGHRGRAATLLGISRKSLWQKLREKDECA